MERRCETPEAEVRPGPAENRPWRSSKPRSARTPEFRASRCGALLRAAGVSLLSLITHVIDSRKPSCEIDTSRWWRFESASFIAFAHATAKSQRFHVVLAQSAACRSEPAGGLPRTVPRRRLLEPWSPYLWLYSVPLRQRSKQSP